MRQYLLVLLATISLTACKVDPTVDIQDELQELGLNFSGDAESSQHSFSWKNGEMTRSFNATLQVQDAVSLCSQIAAKPSFQNVIIANSSLDKFLNKQGHLACRYDSGYALAQKTKGGAYKELRIDTVSNKLSYYKRD